ncbi:unnamed protein product [Urochloa humidicola]
MVSAAAREGASLPREFLWMRRVVAHPLAHAVVYGACGALWALSGGLALGVLGRRAGGDVGARLVSAGNAAVQVAIWPFLLTPLAVNLFGLRAAVSAMESDDPPAPRRRPAESNGEMLRAVLGYVVKDVSKLALFFLLLLMIVGVWMEKRSLGKGSIQEKVGAFMLDSGILGVAVVHCFFICPSWVREWITGLPSCSSQRH